MMKNINEIKEYFKLDGYVIISLKELCSNIKKLDYIFRGNFAMTDNFNKLHYVSFRKGLSSYDILTVDIRNAIIEAFKEYYEGVKLSITDELLDEEIKELENTFASYSPDSFDKEEYEEMLKQLEDLKKERNNL